MKLDWTRRRVKLGENQVECSLTMLVGIAEASLLLSKLNIGI